MGREGRGGGERVTVTARTLPSSRALGLSVMPSPSSYRHAAGPAIIHRAVSRPALTPIHPGRPLAANP